MSYRNTDQSYGSVSKFFHWLIFLLILGLLIVGFIMGDIDDKPTKAAVYGWHKSFGLTVLLLVLFRTFWTLSNPKPMLPRPPKTPLPP